LTGAPGAGKTHLLNRFINYLRKRDVPVAITASTGIAATHIGGMTLHSWSGMGIRDSIDEKILEDLLSKSPLQKRFEKTKVLIIDEVSMLTPGLFEAVSFILQNIHFSQEAFGGIQVVLTGDFFQLPPISSQRSERRFIWQTETWKSLNPKICYLSERHRHNEPELLQLLDEMRAGSVSTDSRKLLKSCSTRSFSKSVRPTKLYTHNADVDEINAEELEKLDTPLRTFGVVMKGNKKIAEKLLNSSLVMEDLELKKGALVMFLKNNPEKDYVNGTLGEIVGFDEEDRLPIVKVKDGREIIAEHEEWSVIDEKDKKLATIAQVPLRLAWAITVHKSQGMTLDAAEIDLRRAFEPGHGYVAISRVKTLSGLRLLGHNEVALSVNNAVLMADAEMQRNSHEIVKQYAPAPVKEKYAPLTKEQEKKRQERFEPKTPTIEKTRKLLKKGLSFSEIATERELKESTILTHFQELFEIGALLFSLDHLSPEKKMTKKILSAKKEVRKRKLPEDKTEKGEIRLGAIFRELKGEYSYEEIKLVLTFDMISKKK